jgi:putative transposon-encoded protein
MIAKKKDVFFSEGPPKGGKANKPFQPKFEVFGEEMIEKEVKQSGNSGRVYLPPEWVGKQVKIIRIN